MAKDVQVMLRQAVPGLGKPGEVVSVRPGYARNYLSAADGGAAYAWTSQGAADAAGAGSSPQAG